MYCPVHRTAMYFRGSFKTQQVTDLLGCWNGRLLLLILPRMVLLFNNNKVEFPPLKLKMSFFYPNSSINNHFGNKFIHPLPPTPERAPQLSWANMRIFCLLFHTYFIMRLLFLVEGPSSLAFSWSWGGFPNRVAGRIVDRIHSSSYGWWRWGGRKEGYARLFDAAHKNRVNLCRFKISIKCLSQHPLHHRLRMFA